MKFEKFSFLDHAGKKINFTCNEAKLGNFFGKNPESPQYLTRISFDKKVLDKYYNEPSRYVVRDGYLFYVKDDGVYKWGLPMDNNAHDCIMAYLGDLGTMPYEEQRHWKLHNILEGAPSSTSYKRDFMAQPASATEPALFFKERLNIFNNKWQKKFGWRLFKELNKGDEYHLQTLRVPSKEQKQFDEVVISLSKIILESLNVSQMKRSINFDENDKSITILEKYLRQKHKFESVEMFKFLRSLQELRSSGSAHSKGKNYKKAYKGFDKGDLSKTFENILIESIKFLNTLENKILREK